MPTPKPTSDVAHLVERPRDVNDRKNPQAFGLCVHTTGSGVPEKAKKLGILPMDVALSVYLAPDNPTMGVFTNFPHYVIDQEGIIVQVAADRERARHCGISQKDRNLYLTGQWKKMVSPSVLSLWQMRWPNILSPMHLFPSVSPNEDYLGCELIPALKLNSSGSLFSDLQYTSLAKLIHDIEGRHSIQLRGNRLVGHEDLEPLTRWTKKEGWDPGGLSTSPKFLWYRLV